MNQRPCTIAFSVLASTSVALSLTPEDNGGDTEMEAGSEEVKLNTKIQ